eukprot:SAG11_NODE_632_length_8057_cov_6.472481_6_plen_191_part_00
MVGTVATVAALALLSATCQAQVDDEDPDLQSGVPPNMFNAAYLKPVIADSYLGDGRGQLNQDALCDPLNPANGCVPTDVTDGYAGNSHRWISSDLSPHHWIAIDLERLEWVTSLAIFAGRDEPGDGVYHPVSGLCSYVFWAWAGDPTEPLTPTLGASDDGWIQIDNQDTETTEETHVRGRRLISLLRFVL